MSESRDMCGWRGSTLNAPGSDHMWGNVAHGWYQDGDLDDRVLLIFSTELWLGSKWNGE